MGSLFWQFVSRTSETEFIFALFHLLLACLTLLVLIGWLRRKPRRVEPSAHLLLTAGFSLFALEFTLTTYCFGAEFFFHKQWNRPLFLELWQALAGTGRLLISAGLLASVYGRWSARATRWVIWGCVAIAGMLLLDRFIPSGTLIEGVAFHTAAMVGVDVLSAISVGAVAILLVAHGQKWDHPSVLALVLLLSSTTTHLVHLFWNSVWSTAGWHVEQHLLSFSLFAFAWAVGERSPNLFERVFVRLNLTFILLASIMILSTVGMERFQYLKLTEESSLSLAEYLRGHLTYYEGRGEDLETILQHPEMLRRIVIGFGELPDFHRLEISLGEHHAVFRYSPDKTITQEILANSNAPPETEPILANEDVPAQTSFRMIRLPINSERRSGDQIEFYGSMDYINRHIGRYIVVIYLLFTVMVAASVVLVGIIVRNADRAIQKQHAEIEGIERQLAQAAKLASIGELAGGVAHEINNPVTGILSTATHLAEKRRDTNLTAQDQQELELIAEEAERISDIVSKLLTFSRQSRMELALVDVNEVLERAVSLIGFRLKNTSVALRRKLAMNLPMVLCDTNRLTEVFVNLMNNAIDAMPSGGVMAIQTQPAGDGYVQIAVSDTGCGIESRWLERIFDPFFTTKELGKGTGLGLSISHGIIKAHQGEIQVESTPGQGSTFVIILPTGVPSNAEANIGRG